jgi:hypothetical protein
LVTVAFAALVMFLVIKPATRGRTLMWIGLAVALLIPVLPLTNHRETYYTYPASVGFCCLLAEGAGVVLPLLWRLAAKMRPGLVAGVAVVLGAAMLLSGSWAATRSARSFWGFGGPYRMSWLSLERVARLTVPGDALVIDCQDSCKALVLDFHGDRGIHFLLWRDDIDVVFTSDAGELTDEGGVVIEWVYRGGSVVAQQAEAPRAVGPNVVARWNAKLGMFEAANA